MTPPFLVIDGKYRLIVPDGLSFDNLFNLIVEDVDLVIQKNDKNGVTDLQVQVLDRHHADLILFEAQNL